MTGSYYSDLLRAVTRELINFKGWVVAIFILVAFSVLGAGLFWPKSYVTGAMLYADVTNIIQPLLQGRAEVTVIDRSQQARESIYTRRIIDAIARKSGMIRGDEPVERQEAIVSGLRNRISIKDEGKNYFRISYSDSNQERSFRVLNTVVDVFIEDAADRKRNESRSAFEFIDEQVRGYKSQLEQAEDRLKNFKARNLYLTEGSVNSRINQLRTQIEDLKLKLEEIAARKRSLEGQLNSESQYLASRNKVDSLRERMTLLQSQLDELRLQYTETYPDIVSLKDQILELELSAEAEQGGVFRVMSSGTSIENPLWEELRKQAADAEVEQQTVTNRLASLERLLAEEHDRAEQVAMKEAELSELTRDYDVTKQIYEEMLERREKARLSMTLDIEGQGVSYKIQEPAIFPLQPAGLRFIHFLAAGPGLGLLAALGLILAYVVLDPRLRSPALLLNQLPPDIELLGVVPHVHTPLAKRVFRSDVMLLGLLAVIAIIVYAGIGAARLAEKI